MIDLKKLDMLIDDAEDGDDLDRDALYVWMVKNGHKLTSEFRRLSRIADELLNHCDKEQGECSVCGRIVCPFKDPLHFHHDGCPSCSDDDFTQIKL